MRLKIMFGFALIVLGVLNYGIYEKQKILSEGDVFFVELAPVDPRSLLQGDFMRLRYQLERDAPVKDLADHEKRGYIVVRPDDQNVAQFVRFHKSDALEQGEKLLRFHKKWRQIRVVPDSFLFQEGHGPLYENAKYGMFKAHSPDKYLLVGLADENRRQIMPEP